MAGPNSSGTCPRRHCDAYLLQRSSHCVMIRRTRRLLPVVASQRAGGAEYGGCWHTLGAFGRYAYSIGFGAPCSPRCSAGSERAIPMRIFTHPQSCGRRARAGDDVTSIPYRLALSFVNLAPFRRVYRQPLQVIVRTLVRRFSFHACATLLYRNNRVKGAVWCRTTTSRPTRAIVILTLLHCGATKRKALGGIY